MMKRIARGKRWHAREMEQPHPSRFEFVVSRSASSTFPSQLVRQWHLLEWLSSETQGVTVEEAAQATGKDQKTIRRDLILLRKAGFDLEETVEDHGRKRWRIRQPFERLRSKRRQYEAIRSGLDTLLKQAAKLTTADCWTT